MNLPHDPYNLIVCGVGGQGNILISRLMGRILSRKGYKVTIGETFGAAQRGGSVYSSLRISKREYYGPLIPKGHGHLVVGLEPIETLRIISKYGNENLFTVSNTHPIYPIGVVAGSSAYPDIPDLLNAIKELTRKSWFLDATAIAIELGNPILSNIILLGGVLGTGILPFNEEEVKEDITKTFPADKLDANLKALELGRKAVCE